MELVNGNLRPGNVEHDGLARKLFYSPVSGQVKVRCIHIDGLAVGEHSDIQFGASRRNGALALQSVRLRLSVCRQLIYIAVDLVLGLHDEIHIVGRPVFRADSDIIPSIWGRVEVRIRNGTGLDCASFHRRRIERNQVGAGTANVDATGRAHFFDGKVCLSVGTARLVAVGHDAVLSCISQDVRRFKRILVVDLVEIDMVNNGGDVVCIIIDAVDTILAARVIGHGVGLTVDRDRRALRNGRAVLGDTEGEGLVAGDGVLRIADTGPVEDRVAIFSGNVFHRIGNVSLAADRFHNGVNGAEIRTGVVALGGVSGNVVHQEGVLAGGFVLNFHIQVDIVRGVHRRRVVQNNLHLVDLLIRRVQTKVGVRLGDRFAFRGFCGCLAVFVVPEIKARNHVRTSVIDLLEVRRHLRVVLQLIQTYIAGIDGRIVMQRTARDVVSAVVHQLEGVRAGNGLRELATRVGSRDTFGRHRDDLHGHQFLVVIQPDAEEILTAKVSVFYQRTADGISMVLVELDVDVMVHAGILIFLEHRCQNIGYLVGVLVRLCTVCQG